MAILRWTRNSLGPPAPAPPRGKSRLRPRRGGRTARACGAAALAWAAAIAPAAAARPGPQEVAAAYQADVRPQLAVPQAEQSRYGDLARRALETAGIFLIAPQYVLVVDRNPNAQAALLYWLPADAPARYLGAAPVSTGRLGEFDHFETPTGVFGHSLDNPDFRAEGTKNANGIRGYGIKGERVYDFGWQQARKGWGDGQAGTMRLQLHSTDPILEKRLGTVQSKGCIRIPSSLNRLIDRYGLLDADYEIAAQRERPPWVLRTDRTTAGGAGRYLIIVDTGRDRRPEWSPPPSSQKDRQP